MPLSRLLLAFGDRGYPLYRQARGLDHSPVRPPSRRCQLQVDETLVEDTNDLHKLQALLFLLVERAGYRLRAGRRQPGAARLLVEYADHRSASRQLRLVPPPADAQRLFHQLLPALEKLTARRTRIRWMGLTLARLQTLERQLPLFRSHGDTRESRLARALDRIRSRYGESAVLRLGPLGTS